MKVLLAIAEEVLAELIAFRLELLSYTVETCGSKAKMMSFLETGGFSTLLLDTSLPDANIRDSIVAVRQKYPRDVLSILCVSLDPSLEMVEQAYRLGANDYILAPFDLNTLQTKVDRLCSTEDVAVTA